MRHCLASQIVAINLKVAYDHYSPLAFQASLLNLVVTDIFAKLEKSCWWEYKLMISLKMPSSCFNGQYNDALLMLKDFGAVSYTHLTLPTTT